MGGAINKINAIINDYSILNTTNRTIAMANIDATMSKVSLNVINYVVIKAKRIGEVDLFGKAVVSKLVDWSSRVLTRVPEEKICCII